jgi:Methyltransferase domain
MTNSSLPLVRRPFIYDFIPQTPGWFMDVGHMKARRRFGQKLTQSYTWEEVQSCPICAGRDFIPIANQERHGLPIHCVMCRSCALIFNSPRLTQSSLADHYQADYRLIERGNPPDLHNMMFKLQASKAPLVAAALQQAKVPLLPTSRLADVGCGEGGLLSHLKILCPQSVGFELNTEAAAYGRSQGVTIFNHSLPDDAEPFDLILYEQVLEHIADLQSEIANLVKALKPGGHFYVTITLFFISNMVIFGIFHWPTLSICSPPLGYHWSRATR